MDAFIEILKNIFGFTIVTLVAVVLFGGILVHIIEDFSDLPIFKKKSKKEKKSEFDSIFEDAAKEFRSEFNQKNADKESGDSYTIRFTVHKK